jgi:hypothetical protein
MAIVSIEPSFRWPAEAARTNVDPPRRCESATEKHALEASKV